MGFQQQISCNSHLRGRREDSWPQLQVSRVTAGIEFIPIQKTILVAINPEPDARTARDNGESELGSRTCLCQQSIGACRFLLPVRLKNIPRPIIEPATSQAVLRSLGDQVHPAGGRARQRQHRVKELSALRRRNRELATHGGGRRRINRIASDARIRAGHRQKKGNEVGDVVIRGDSHAVEKSRQGIDAAVVTETESSARLSLHAVHANFVREIAELGDL